MRVHWADPVNYPEEHYEHLDDPVIAALPMFIEYTGEVLGSVTSFFSGTRLVVACEDGCIREVEISRVRHG